MRQYLLLFLALILVGCGGIVSSVMAGPCDHPNAEQYGRAADYATLANEVYNPNGGTPPPGWNVVEANAHDSGVLGSGMQYAVYENPETGEVVLSFRGTESPTASPADVIADIVNGAGLPTQQYDEALAVAVVMRARYGDKLTVTGHSLGGGLATYTAHALSLPATTFNPAPVGIGPLAGSEVATWGGASGARITNFVHEDDPLYSYVRYLPTGQSLGTDVVLTNDGDFVPAEGTSAHSIINFVNHFDGFRDCVTSEGDSDGGNGSDGGGSVAGPGGGDSGAGALPPSTPAGSRGKGGVLQPFR